MTLPVRKSLHDAVLQASKADTWEQATKEWNEVSLIFNGIGRSNCVCGNAIKYAYELFNGVTGQRLFPIGSDCVRHFHRLSLDQQLEEEEKLLRKVENLTRKAQKKEKIKVNKSDFDERLLKWLWEKGVFKPNRGNQFAPERDYQLFLEVFQGGSWTKAEPKKKARMEEVLEKCIKPFLLGKSDDQLYLVKLGLKKNASGKKFFLVKIEQNELSRPNNTKKSWKKTNELPVRIQLKENRNRLGSSIPIFVSFLKKKLDFLGSY